MYTYILLTLYTVCVSGVENLLLGIVSASFSAALTTPLDVLKTRMMTTRESDSTNNKDNKSVFSILTQLYRLGYLIPTCIHIPYF